MLEPKTKGRKPILSEAEQIKAVEMTNNHSIKSVAKHLKITKRTLENYITKHKNHEQPNDIEHDDIDLDVFITDDKS
nr:hypothetical protein [Moritella viscosa]SHO01240.1 Putative resolvase [Moritella viscosa]